MKGSPAKILGKLNAKMSRFDRSPSGTDGLTALDIAHALGLNRNSIQPKFIRVKFSGDAAGIASLVDGLSAIVAKTASRKKWRVRKTDTIERMVIMALREREVIRPRRVLTIIDGPYETGAEKCRSCRGREHREWKHKVITCTTCGGNGERHWSDAERAAHCGLHHSVWADNWEARYFDVVFMLKTIESRALRLIRAYTSDTREEMLDILDGSWSP